MLAPVIASAPTALAAPASAGPIATPATPGSPATPAAGAGRAAPHPFAHLLGLATGNLAAARGDDAAEAATGAGARPAPAAGSAAAAAPALEATANDGPATLVADAAKDAGTDAEAVPQQPEAAATPRPDDPGAAADVAGWLAMMAASPPAPGAGPRAPATWAPPGEAGPGPLRSSRAASLGADGVAAAPAADARPGLLRGAAPSRPSADRPDTGKAVTAAAANADAGTSIVAVRDATPPATSTDAADRSRALLEVASVTASASPAAPSATSPAAPLHAAATPPNAFPAGSPAPADARLSAFPGSPDFAPQLGTQLTTFVREGVQHARLELNPAAMGPVTVQIQLDGQTAQVHLSADHAQTRQALEQAMPLLASGLREAGFTLGGGGVFEQPRQAPQGSAAPSGNGRRGRDGGLDGEREAETAALSATRPGRRRGVVDLVA